MTADYFRQKADQCRRLAKSILIRDDPTAAGLHALAVEFDSQAALIEAETATTKLIGDDSEAAPANDIDGKTQN
jgi:hypothetical protein